MDKKSFHQWDLDQRLVLTDVKVGTEIHFCNSISKDTECLSVLAKEENGVVYVEVPNIILQIAGSFKVYVWPFHTTQYQQIAVIARPKPVDYVYTETELYTVGKMVEDALAKAKENGDFKGDPGDKGDKGDPYVLTEEDLTKIVNSVLQSMSSPARIGYVTLLADKWVGDNTPYSQVVELEGVTENSQVDLTPNVEQLSIFHHKDLAFVTENNGGIVTVYAIGEKPQNDYTIQVTLTEVEI